MKQKTIRIPAGIAQCATEVFKEYGRETSMLPEMNGFMSLSVSGVSDKTAKALVDLARCRTEDKEHPDLAPKLPLSIIKNDDLDRKFRQDNGISTWRMSVDELEVMLKAWD